jgi:hypothetical protein
VALRAALLIGLAGLAANGPAAAKTPDWRVYADCSAAYLTNARVTDPDRPPSMTTQVTELSNDYADASRGRYRQQARATPRAALVAVRARVQSQARRYAGQPREAVERVIDACPQLN